MAALAGFESGTGPRTGERRLSWPVFLLTLVAVTSSSLSALSLYQLVALRAEVEGLKSEVYRRREEGQEAKHAGQVRDNKLVFKTPSSAQDCTYCSKHFILSVQTENMSRRSSQEPLHQPGTQDAFTLTRNRRLVSGSETLGKTR